MYESNIQTAYNLISKKGLAVGISRKTSTGYSVATGTMTVSTVSETGYAVVVKNIENKTLEDDNYITILLSAKGITRPQLGDSVTLNTTAYVISKLNALAPNYDEPIIYTIELRR